MRRGSKPDFIKNNSEIVGINLSCDFCSEHEWGIKDLKRSFNTPTQNEVLTHQGIYDDSIVGLKARKIQTYPTKKNDWNKFLQYFNIDDIHYLIFDHSMDHYIVKKEHPSELKMFKHYNDKEEPILATAWDGDSFGIAVRVDANSKKYSEFLDDLNEAFKKNDIVITFGGKESIFGNSGLVILIASKIPQEIVKGWEEADLSYFALQKEAHKKFYSVPGSNNKVKLSIQEILKKANKEYFALSPRWSKDIKNSHTDYQICFWLNPMHQQQDNYGYFTIENLLDWADNKGPIPMTLAQKKHR